MEYEAWPLGDRALLLRFGESACASTNRLVHAACATIASARLGGVRRCAPAYASLILELDLIWLARYGGIPTLLAHLQGLLAGSSASDTGEMTRVLEIPTIYGGPCGPDLAEVAERTRMNVAQVVELHSQPIYLVAMLGFLPGFPYLLGLPEALHLPRRESVRTQLAAGSVAIAGAQAGIYPESSPGGWHLIGRTDDIMFDPARTRASLLAPGDRVRFVPVAVSS